MTIDRIGVHPSVVKLFPPERFPPALEDLDASALVLDGDLAGLDGCDAVVTFDHVPAFLDAVPWVHSVQAGYEHFPLDDFEAAGVALTSSTGIHGTSVGETVTGYLLMLARRLHTYVARAEHREWYHPPWDGAFTVAGESLCVVGLGTIGRAIARRADALGLAVTGVKRTPEPVPAVDRVLGPDALHEAIADARFVSIAVPLTEATRHLFGPAEFDAMREDAFLINVSRGPVVDEAAFAAAVRDGTVAGGALDVYEEEPLPEDSPLWDLEDVVLTPHRAALTVDYYRDVAALVRENVRRLEAGEALRNRVV